MCSAPQVADALHSVLNDQANELARSSGFVQRASKMTGALWVQTLVFTWLSNARAAATFLRPVLEAALGAVVEANEAATPLLARFNGVYLFDSTVLALPDRLASLWKGCGGRVEQVSYFCRYDTLVSCHVCGK